MTMNNASRRQVLQCLRELADIDFQERVWIKGEGPEVSSYPELVSQLYDDTSLGDLLERGEGEPVFSSETDSLLQQLSTILDDTEAHASTADVLRTPQWAKIRSLALRASKLVEESMAE